MIKITFISIILLLLCSPCFAEILFEDDFKDQTKINTNNNIIIISNSARVTNSGTNYLISIPIFRQTNQEWQELTLNFETPHPSGGSKLTIKISDQNNTTLKSEEFDSLLTTMNPTTETITLSEPLSIKNAESIKLKAEFDYGTSSGPLILYSWEVTGAEIPDPDPVRNTNAFIGAPSPLEINDEDSRIKFYYMFKKDCEATFEILDPNYNLVKTLFENKTYSSGESLNTTWNGKNGNEIYVMSGVYIAILKINNDGTEGSPDPFIFAVIR